jgi:hemolysin D
MNKQEEIIRQPRPTQRPRTLPNGALDFAPGLLSIQESPPTRLPRAVLHTVAMLFAILLLWSIFGTLDIVASAEGRLVPQTYVKIVQPSDAGIVQEILVNEGEAVKAGQVLMRMNMKIAKADEQSLQTDLALRSLQLHRIDSELFERPLLRRPNDPADLFRQVESQLKERRQAYVDALAQHREALKKAEYEYDSAREVMTKLREVTPILRQQAEAYADLGKQGFAGQIMVRDKEREYIEKAQDLRAQAATVESLQAAIAQTKQQINQVSSQYRSNLHNERLEADGYYQKLQHEWVKQEHKSGLLELRAPQNGVVKDIATHTKGAVVSPGTVLLTVVPEDEPLVAEIMVKNDDVGFVFTQQKVKIKVVAYPFAKYGMLDGQVRHLGPDAADGQFASPDQTKEAAMKQNLSYKALVSLDTQTLSARGEQFKLVPGMQVIVEISQGKRTVMEYLLSPVRIALHDSARER